MLRTLSRFSIAALIGICVTLGWQSYGDTAKEMVITRSPTLAWLLPASTTKHPVVDTISSRSMQQLEALAFNLDVVRRSVEQLAAKQEQITQNFAALQAIQEEIKEKVSSTPPSPTPQPASIPQNNLPQPRAQPLAVRSPSAPRPPAPAGPQLSR
jgi:hypothetical protein